jgi:hypothetical protein
MALALDPTSRNRTGRFSLNLSSVLRRLARTHRNAAAIYGSTYGPIQGEASFRTTERGNSNYLFAMDSSAEDIRVEGLPKTVSRVQMVATGKPVAFTAGSRRDSHSRREGIVEQWDSCD